MPSDSSRSRDRPGADGRERPWEVSKQIARAFARAALGAGEFLLAGEAARAGLRSLRGDAELEQLLARSLAQLGSAAEARQILIDLERSAGLDAASLGELFCLRGDLSLQEGLDAPFDESRRASLLAALEDYERAGQVLPSAPTPLLKSAAAHSLLGEAHRADAARLARRALEALERGASRDARHALIDRAKAFALLGRDRRREGRPIDERRTGTTLRSTSSVPRGGKRVCSPTRRGCRRAAMTTAFPRSS